MKYLSVCSGIEAATVAWHPLGWEPVGFSEIEPFPSAVLAHHYPHVPNFGDMTKFQEWPLNAGAIDILVAGTPCQSFSVAGLRQGLRDPRGNLMLTYLAIAARFRPRWVVWENVPGVLSSNGGLDFGSLLGGLGQLGYGISYRVLDAQWVRTHGHPRAVPQRRRRVFVVGCLGDATAAAKVLFERESVLRNSKTRGTAREEIAADAKGSVGTGFFTSHNVAPCLETTSNDYSRADGFTMVAQPIIEQVKWPADVAPTLNQSRIGSGSPGYSNQELFSQGGGGLIPVAIQGNLIGRDKGGPTGVGATADNVMYTMTKADVHGVAHAIPPDLRNSQRDTQATTITMVNMQGSKSNVCVATDGTSFTLMHGHDVHAVAHAIPLDLRNSQRDPEKNNANNRQGFGVGNVGDPALTVDASFVHGVAHAFYSTGGSHGLNQQPEVCPPIKVGSSLGIPSPPAVVQCVAPTITAGNNPSRSPQSAEVTQQIAAVHAASMTVRRLTPRECERLQGFPDDYTLIPWRKKAAGDCPDGPRYKALGNSMAVNCMEWIGERIAAVEAGEDK